jgi:NADH-quinone oxidoreductase subunit N
VGLVTSVFALYYYANVIRTMYFSTEQSPFRITFSPPALAVIIIGLVGVLVVGLYPEPVLRFASEIPMSFGLILP